MSFYSIVLLLIAGQGFFLFIMLVLKKSRRVMDHLLSALVFIFSYHIFYIFLIKSNTIFETPHLIATCFCLQTLIPTLFYWYIVKNSISNYTKKDFWHLIPFIIHVLYWTPFFIMEADTKLAIFSRSVTSIRFQEFGFTIFVLIQMSLFLFYSCLLKKLNDLSFNTWLVRCRNIFWIISFLFLFDGALYIVKGSQYYSFYHLILALLVYYIAYFGFNRQEEVYYQEKYISGKLSPSQLQTIMSHLSIYMEKEKPFLMRDLRIKDVSNALGWPESDISQAINSSMKISFRDYLNKHRVEEAKRLLHGDKANKLKNLAVAYDSGFNNKVSFYKSFSKFVGMTPKEFRNG